MPAAGQRKTLAGVTLESYDGWDAFAERHVNPLGEEGKGDVTALAEVVGFHLAQYAEADKLPAWLERIVRDAVELHRERHDRSGPRPRD